MKKSQTCRGSELEPLLKAAVGSDMKEASQNWVTLQCSTPTREVMARLFYEQDLKLEFPHAADLVDIALLYDIPDLLEIAILKIKAQQDLTVLLMDLSNLFI